jgi:hypothetical protein
MNRNHLLVSTAVAAVLAFSSQAEAGLLGGGAAGGFGGSLSRGPISGSMNGDLNGRFGAKPDVAAPIEHKATGAAQDAKGFAGSATHDAKSAGTGASATAKGTATQAASPATTAGVSTDHSVDAAGSAGNTLAGKRNSNSGNPLPSANASGALGGSLDGNAGMESPAHASVEDSSVASSNATASAPKTSAPSEARQTQQ